MSTASKTNKQTSKQANKQTSKQANKQDWHKNDSTSILRVYSKLSNVILSETKWSEESIQFGIQAIIEKGADPEAEPQDDNKKKTGFTLAEVLLVITVIGIIAINTIPSLVTNVQKQNYYYSFRKSYNTLTNLSYTLLDEYNNNLAIPALNNNLGPIIINKLQVIKNCGTTPDQGCWYSTPSKMLDGSLNPNFDSYFDSNSIPRTISRAILVDGSLILIADWTLTFPDGLSVGTGAFQQSLGWVFVDINGYKKPNQEGRDIFYFYITKTTGIVPIGSSGDTMFTPLTTFCNAAIVGSGVSCGAKLLFEGQMNY